MRYALALVLLVVPAAAQDRTMATFNDWSLRCENAPARQCEIGAVVNNAQGRPMAQMLVGRLGAQGQQVVAAQVPLAVHIPGQVRLVLDGETTRLDYQRCVPEGCFAMAEMNDALLRRLRAEPATARIVIQDANRQDVTLNLSLRGFARAQTALAEAQASQRR